MNAQDVLAPTAPAGSTRVTGGRIGGWLLTLSPLAFVGLAVMWLTLMNQVAAKMPPGSAQADITREIMDETRGLWILGFILSDVLSSVVIVGATLLAFALLRALSGTGRTIAAVTVAVGVLVLVGYAVDLSLSIAASNFTAARVGDDPTYQLSNALFPWIFGGALLQLALLSAVLWTTRLRPVAGLVLGILSIVALILMIVTGGFVPPFVLGLIGCPIGISWLRGLRRARRGLS